MLGWLDLSVWEPGRQSPLSSKRELSSLWTISLMLLTGRHGVVVVAVGTHHVWVRPNNTSRSQYGYTDGPRRVTSLTEIRNKKKFPACAATRALAGRWARTSMSECSTPRVAIKKIRKLCTTARGLACAVIAVNKTLLGECLQMNMWKLHALNC